MTRRRADAGRYTVGDSSFQSRYAAVAYCLTLALRERRDQYVREIGKEDSLYRAQYRDGASVLVRS